MNILLVNHYAGHPSLGMEFRPFYMAVEWQKKGHTVEIVASSFSHVRHTQPKSRSWWTHQVLDKVRYTWIRSLKYQGNGLMRVANMFVFLAGLYLYGRFSLKNKPDVIIASSTYPLDVFICKKLADYYQARLVFEVHDLWPLSPIEIGGVSPKHPFMRLLQAAEDYAYKNADKVVSILPCTLSHMVQHGLDSKKFVSIPNGVLLGDWSPDHELPEEHQSLIEKLRAKHQFIVAYGGAHGIANDLDALIEAAVKVPDDVHIVLFGDGPEKSRLIEKAKSLNLTNVHFLPSIPKNLVPAMLEQVDTLYIGLVPQPLFRFGVSPNKLIDYMMAAKPIIYAIDSGNHPVLDADCGIEVAPGQALEIAEGISGLKETPPARRLKMGQNGRAYAAENHSYEKLAHKFLQALH